MSAFHILEPATFKDSLPFNSSKGPNRLAHCRINASLAALQRTVVDLQQAQANMVTEDKIKEWIQDAIQSVSVAQPGQGVVQKETGGFKSVGEFETLEAVKLQLQT